MYHTPAAMTPPRKNGALRSLTTWGLLVVGAGMMAAAAAIWIWG